MGLEGLIEKLPAAVLGVPLRRSTINEVSNFDYFDRYIAEPNKRSIRGLLMHLMLNYQRIGAAEVGVIAFGSSVRPEELRTHPVGDIDLRIVSNPPKDPVTGELVWGEIVPNTVDLVREFAEHEGQGFEYNPRSTVNRIPMLSPYGTYFSFMDYNNQDPSFIVEPHEGGLPLHISISHSGSETLDSRLREEVRQRQHYSLLARLSSSLGPTRHNHIL